MEVQRAEGMEVQSELISLAWSLCHCCLQPSPLGAFVAVRTKEFGFGRYGFVGVANQGLLLLCCFWVGCCFVVFLASLFLFFQVAGLLHSLGFSGLLLALFFREIWVVRKLASLRLKFHMELESKKLDMLIS